MLAYPATLQVTMPNGEQCAYQDPTEAELCMEEVTHEDNQTHTPQCTQTPGKPQCINRPAYFIPKDKDIAKKKNLPACGLILNKNWVQQIQ